MTKKISTFKTMTDLEHNDCRWPIGDPRQPGFHFCGAKQELGRPYCSHHWEMSFIPGKGRNNATRSSQPLLAFQVRRAA